MRKTRVSVLIDYLAAKSATPQHELVQELLEDTGCLGTIELTVAQVGHWMERYGLCKDYRDILDQEIQHERMYGYGSENLLGRGSKLHLP